MLELQNYVARARIGFAFAGVALLALLSVQASAATRFGAKLDAETQPSNAGTGHFCVDNNPGVTCSWVLEDAFQREFPAGTNGHLAPKNGTIAHIRLIACAPGTFVLQVGPATGRTTKNAKVTRSGPVINYKGDPQHCEEDTFKIETFNVNVPVLKNDYLTVYANKVGFLRCSSGGTNSLKFNPPLADGGGFRASKLSEGCWLLLEAEYAN
jgi:hypothetical protein